MRIVLTGADGFLGRHLADAFRAQGWDVAGLVRDPKGKSLSGQYFHYAFPADLDPAVSAEPADVVVHCAFAMKEPRENYHVNREAAAFLRRQFPAARFLFISSMSAHEAAESLYGREKLYIEHTLDPSRDLAIRPGFIIGAGGVFANLARSIRSLPAIPLFYGGRQPIQTVHIDDLCAAIVQAISLNLTGLLSYGEVEPVQLRDFYQAIANGLRVHRPLIPAPGGLALAALRTAEGLGLRLPMTSENLLGLKRLIEVDVRADVERLQVTPRTMTQSLSTIDWSAL
ncbi:MAG TPA: NAD-dependent epimerase/dehydratase family protein [Bryobacteraceae bacterium]